MKYDVYTDGACSVSKKLGGYAAIAKFDGQQIVVHGNKVNATNNEMELLAAVTILQILHIKLNQRDSIFVHSDSAYIVNAIQQNWIKRWCVNGWKTKEGKAVKNRSLWMKLNALINDLASNSITCSFIKVKGHSTCKLNNYVDRLAVKECQCLNANKQLED